MMSNHDHLSACLEAIRCALIRDWDPIGVGAIAEAQNEYDAYAPTLAQMLLERRSRAEIVEYLWWLEHEHMGLAGDRVAIEQFADRLMQIAAEFLSDRPG